MTQKHVIYNIIRDNTDTPMIPKYHAEPRLPGKPDYNGGTIHVKTPFTKRNRIGHQTVSHWSRYCIASGVYGYIGPYFPFKI